MREVRPLPAPRAKASAAKRKLVKFKKRSNGANRAATDAFPFAACFALLSAEHVSTWEGEKQMTAGRNGEPDRKSGRSP